ncbi:MAG: MoaD/ThiS family protein [Gammaproteobacteria bacterium]|nr:MoaD/ThiS family protein [Gammaproteobacteria bacterium]
MSARPDDEALVAQRPETRRAPGDAPSPATLTVKYCGLVRIAAGTSAEEIPIGDSGTVGSDDDEAKASGGAAPRVAMTLGQLLDRLAARHGPDFAYYTRATDGSLLPHALVVVDGVSVRRGQCADLRLAAGKVTEIMVVPAMCGG